MSSYVWFFTFVFVLWIVGYSYFFRLVISFKCVFLSFISHFSSVLYCSLIFSQQEKQFWKERNFVDQIKRKKKLIPNMKDSTMFLWSLIEPAGTNSSSLLDFYCMSKKTWFWLHTDIFTINSLHANDLNPAQRHF